MSKQLRIKLIDVTPHVGVWIETLKRVDVSRRFRVTPHVGVWIETRHRSSPAAKPRSHLM